MEYTVEQVAKHNKEADCWITINGKVYDPTRFLDEHPGGGEIVAEYAGKDATEAFDDIGHSEEAIEMLKDFYKGDLAAGNDKRIAPKAAATGRWTWRTLVMLLAVITLGVVVWRFAK